MGQAFSDIISQIANRTKDLVWSLGALPEAGIQAATYAAYASRSYPSYPSFSFSYPSGVAPVVRPDQSNTAKCLPQIRTVHIYAPAPTGFPTGCGYFPQTPGGTAITGVSQQNPTAADGYKTAYYDSTGVVTPTLTPTAPITPTLATDRLTGTYYDSSGLGTVTISGGDQRANNAPIQVTAAAAAAVVAAVNHGTVTHTRNDHMNSTPMMRTTVMNSYPQGYGPPTSPATSRGYGHTGSPGPMDVFSANPGDGTVGYVQAASPQPTSFPVAVNRGALIAAYANGYH